MPNYYLDIIDTENSDYTTALENARRNNIVLSWQGKDALDELVLVGSTVRFDMEVPVTNNIDAAFISLFTGDEQRYRVEIRRESDAFLVWQGFLLPDAYNEPYKGGNFFVNFEAVDGLGRLRGKYLPDEYYEVEKSVVDIITSCLALTGLQFDVVLAPGIDNKQEKDWNNIYLYGAHLMNGEKQKDAYTILNDIVHDTGSRCYQHLGRWFIEGLNKSGMITYSAHIYDYEGALISQSDITKVVKNVSGLQLKTPNVTMQAPYKLVTVEHARVPLTLPETVAQEQNDGWVKAAGVDLTIYATDWIGRGGYFATAFAPDYFLYIDNGFSATLDTTQYISLLKKLYVSINTKLRFKAKFKLNEGVDTDIYLAAAANKLRFSILLNGEVLHTNVGTTIPENTNIEFDSDREAFLDFDFLVPESGLLDIRIYQVYGTFITTNVLGVWVENLELSEINPATTLTYTDELNGDFTKEKDITLTYADDATGLSSAFTLAKVHEPNTNLFNTIQVDVLDYIFQNGNHYSVVSLQGANAIADNIDSVWRSGEIIPITAVIYNYRGGEQMVIQTEEEYSDGFFIVFKYAVREHQLDRTHWQEWTDSVYNAENKRFGSALAGMYRNLFNEPRVVVDFTTDKTPLLLGDIIQWNYIENRYYTPTNANINFDSGNSTVTMCEAVYVSETSLLPPYVDCGPTIYIGEVQTSALINATAFDPDGTIVSYLWEKVSGDAGETINFPTSEDTTIDDLTGDEYTFQLTVTDDDGLTASDTVDIIRVVDYALSFDLDSSTYFETPYSASWEYDLNISPTLLPSLAVTCGFTIRYFIGVTAPISSGAVIRNTVRLRKNGSTLQTWERWIYGTEVDPATNIEHVVEETSVFNIIAGDDIDVDIFFEGDGATFISLNARFTIDTAVIENYPGVVTNVPLEVYHTSA